MPGSWEMKPPEVLVGILTREIVTTAWAFSLRNLILPPSANIIPISGMPFDHARNSACEKVLEHNFTWLFFLDDDVIPPSDVFSKLVSRGKDIISGLYFRRAEPIMPVMLRHTSERPQFITDFNLGDVIEADLVGAGCLLIHRRVIEKMKSNWFEWRVDHKHRPDIERTSEDFTFCTMAKEMGFKVYVDTSVRCQHAGIGKSEFPGTYSPLSAQTVQ